MALASPVQVRSAFQEGVAEFVRKGRAVFDFPHHVCCPIAISGIKRLIADPNRGAWELLVPRPGEPDDGADDGLVRKGKTYPGQANDNKWFFHFRTALPDLLRERGVSTAGYEDLFEVCNIMHAAHMRFLDGFAAAFDRVCPGYGLARLMDTPLARELGVLRIVIYDPKNAAHNVNNIVARQHTDRCCIAFQVMESGPALHLGAEREPYVVRPDKMLAFAGQKFERLTNGRWPAIPHDVQDNSDTDESRWAVIFFSHIPGQDGTL